MPVSWYIAQDHTNSSICRKEVNKHKFINRDWLAVSVLPVRNLPLLINMFFVTSFFLSSLWKSTISLNKASCDCINFSKLALISLRIFWLKNHDKYVIYMFIQIKIVKKRKLYVFLLHVILIILLLLYYFLQSSLYASCYW